LIAGLHDCTALDAAHPLDLGRVGIRLGAWRPAHDVFLPEQEAALIYARRTAGGGSHAHHSWGKSQTQTALAPEEALRRYRRCVVLGDAGAGKTTLLEQLALGAAQGRLAGLPSLPLFVSLHLYARSGCDDLLDFVADDWQARYGFSDARACLENHLAAGEVLLLLDGLDEAGVGPERGEAEAAYRRVVESINALAERYRELPVVVTLRPAAWRDGLVAGFETLQVLDLAPDQVERFVADWFYDAPQQAKALLRELARNDRLAALAANPLRLALLVLVYHQDQSLPERPAELYARGVRALLGRWDAGRGRRCDCGLDADQQRALLETVAWHLHCAGRRYFSRPELLAVVADFLPLVGLPASAAGRVVDALAVRRGLLLEQPSGGYGFVQRALQEYLAARAAVQRGALEVVLAAPHHPWWQEVTLRLAGLGDAAPLLRALLALPEDVFCSNLRLAGRCLVACSQLSDPTLGQEIQAGLHARLQQAALSIEAGLLADVLVELGGVENNERLLAKLADEAVNWPARVRIAAALGARGERGIAPRLVGLLADEALDWRVRVRIAAALEVLGERGVAPALVALLADETVHAMVRGRIATVLETLGSQDVARRLVGLLADNAIDWSVKGRIGDALAALGERCVAPELVELLVEDDLDAFVRWRIVAALGALGERSVAPRLLEILSEETLSVAVRSSAASALKALGERGVVPRLLELLADERVDWQVRDSIATALGALGEQGVAPRLLEMLDDGERNAFVRGSVAAALGALGERDVAPRLLELLVEERIAWSVRRRIAAALGALGERSVAPRLVELLAEEKVDWRVRRYIAEALGALGERSVAPALADLLADEALDASVRGSVAAALGALGERSVVPRLLELLVENGRDAFVRGRIATALGVLGERDAAPRLLEVLIQKTADGDVLGRAAMALAALGERGVAQRLVELLADEALDAAVRGRIAEALGVLGERSVAPVLVELLADEAADATLRRQVAASLAVLGDTAGVVRELAGLLGRCDDADLCEALYAALYRVAQRAGVRVRVLLNGDLEVD